MPEFLYKPEHESRDEITGESEIVPGQILAEFGAGESATGWLDWLTAHGFPSPGGQLHLSATTGQFDARDYFVWVPSREHAMLHRLTWGGKIAVD